MICIGFLILLLPPEALPPSLLSELGISDALLADLSGNSVVGHCIAAELIAILCHYPMEGRQRMVQQAEARNAASSSSTADSVINDIVGAGPVAQDDDDDEDDDNDDASASKGISLETELEKELCLGTSDE